MNRIQQILSKAERDGTARRLTTVDAPPNEERPPLTGPRELPRRQVRDAARDLRAEPAPGLDYAPAYADEARRDEPVRPPAVAQVIEPVAYADPPPTEQSVDVVLDPLLVAATAPQSPAAEHYRSLRSRIAQMERDQIVRVIQITSPGKGDGKTITALNLALTMAQEFQRRVLAIDADLRNPRVHALLGLPPGPGLVEVLTGEASLQDALVDLPEYHLTVLRAGHPYDRPAEMLGSAPMRRLVDTLRAQFDRIVIDSAPAIVSDPGAIAPIVDGMLLVVRSGVTTRPAIARSIADLPSSKLLGLVFNESEAPVDAPYGAGA